MKPDGARPRKRRGAMYLAQLAWLVGFPTDDSHWHVLGGDTRPIDGAEVARARRAARTLLREHRDELAERVDDVERWWTIVDRKLAWCSKHAHALDLIDMMPSRAARRARAITGELGQAIQAAAITWATEPADLARAIAWLADRPSVMAHGLERAIELAALAVLAGPDGIDAMLRLVEIDAPEPAAARDRVNVIYEQVKGNYQKRQKPFAPPPRIAHKLTKWLSAVIVRPPDIRRRTMQLVAVVGLAEAFQPWRDWFDSHEPALVRALGYKPRKTDESWPNMIAVMARVEEVKRAMPGYIVDIGTVLGAIEIVTRDEARAAAACRLLAYVPRSISPVARIRMLWHMAKMTIEDDGDDRRVAQVWAAIADELDRGADPKLFAMWWTVLDRDGNHYLETEIFANQGTRTMIKRWAKIVGAIGASYPAAKLVAMWLEAGLGDDAIIEAVEAEQSEQHIYSVELARAAIALGHSPQDIISVYAALHDAGLAATPAIANLARCARRDDATWLFRGALASRTDVVDVVSVAKIVAVTRLPRWTTPTATSWIERYPAELHPCLRRLASVHPDAAGAAENRLGTDLPNPAALQREIDAIRARGTLSPSLAKRVANLEQRLASPRPPSPARLANLIVAIDELAITTGFDRYRTAIVDLAVERIATWFGLGEATNLALDHRTSTILVALANLDDDHRALAARLLRARTGPKPWDLRDDPANLKLVARMRERGVDLDPWLDDSRITVTARDGKPLEIGFADDPLDVFAMGAHFETCLAPDGSNFFSVVTNAADVNKRVLYAYRDGRVVGRCLYALTDLGEVLTFHVYAHDGGIGFDDIVRDHVMQLAAKMHASVGVSSHVSLILGSDWYDDGARDVTGRFEKLSKFPFKTIDPADLVDKLREVLGTEIDAVTLPHVIRHQAMFERPELVQTLAPLLLRDPRVDGQTMVQAANLAWRARDLALTDQLIGNRERLMPLEFPSSGPFAVLRPSQTLVRLRAARGRRETWRDDPLERQATLALALAALHRPAQSQAIARVVADQSQTLSEALRVEIDNLPGV